MKNFNSNTSFLAIVALVISMVIWSLSGIAIKQALVVLPPLTMIILRFGPAVIMMLIIGLIFRNNTMLGLQRIEKRDIPMFVFAGFCQPFLYYLLETFSYRALSSPTIAEALLSTSPLLSPILAAVMLKERVTRNNIIGIVLSTIGMLILILVGSKSFSIGSYWGVMLAFLAVSAAVMSAVMMRKTPDQYSPLSFVFYTQLVSLCFFIPLWAVKEGFSPISDLRLQISDLEVLTALGSVAYLSVFSSVIAFILFFYALRKLGVTQANAFNNIRPAFTALWMIIFFGEQLPLAKWIGMILIIFGLFVCQYKEKVSDN